MRSKKNKIKIIYKDGDSKMEIDEFILTSILAESAPSSAKSRIIIRDKGEKIGCMKRNASGNWEFFKE